MKDKAKETVKAEAKPRKKVAVKTDTDSKTKVSTTEKAKTSKKSKKKNKDERVYRALGSRFTAEEFKYVERMIKELLPIYKSKNKMLLGLTREYISSPLNDDIVNKNKKIFLGRWATIFGSYDIRKVLIVYLQLTKRLFIAPTRKFSKYPFIALEMLDTDGKRVGIIVKIDNGLVDLEAIDKMKEKIRICIFTSNEEKQELGDRDIECIFLKDVFEVMEKYQFLLPSSIVKKFKRLEELE